MKVYFVSLGCDKNLVDSEYMLGLIRQNGFLLTDNEKEAEIIVVNTCCFIHDACEESINTLLELSLLKKNGKLKVLICTGCLAQRYKDEIKKSIPEIDAVVGTTAAGDIVDTIKSCLTGDKKDAYRDINYLCVPDVNRVNTTGGYTGYLKIAEGCSKHCTYCVIPSLKGEYRSVPMEKLLKEAKFMAEGGLKELIIVAQETTVYGIDIYGHKALPELLEKLSSIDGIEWIRLLYCYPEEITADLINCMKNNKKICHYIDMPIQHSQDNILSRMGRHTNRKELDGLIKELRKEIPDIVLRTSLIVGFPGETEEDFDGLMGFVSNTRFDRLGVFTYSREDGTPAAKMKDQVPKKLKLSRQKKIMELQQKIVFERNYAMAKEGLAEKVIIEGSLPDETDDDEPEIKVYIARTYRDAPSIDGYIFIRTARELESGDMPTVRITGAKGYDLTGELL
jgi:ribosomal protein S12 methylthiotransferase